jgi:hypothetical protein
MTLTRIKSWIPGEILTAADLNAEFNNLLGNPTTLISPLQAALDFNNHRSYNFVLEHTVADPPPSPASEGRLFYDAVTDQVKVDTGTAIQVVGPGVIVTSTSTATSTSTSGSVVTVMGGMGTHVKGLHGTISSNLATFQAFEFLFQSTSPSLPSYLMTGMKDVSFTINCQTAGPVAGGRDVPGGLTGTQAHYYAITTGENSTSPAGTVSSLSPHTSDGGPALPTSYVGWAYLCSAVYNVTSSVPAVLSQTVCGGQTHLITTSNFAGAGQGNGAGVPIVASAGTSSVETSVRVDAYVPAMAPSYFLQHVGSGGLTSAGGSNVEVQTVLEEDFQRPIHTLRTRQYGVAGGMTFQGHSVVSVPNTNAPASFVYYTIATAGSGTPQVYLNVTGYMNSNGDA